MAEAFVLDASLAIEWFLPGINEANQRHAAGMPEIVRMGLAYHLQGYDALYFDLAKVNEVPIATFDRGILTACKRFNVERLAV